MEFDVSIILLTKNGGDRLKELMESIKAQNFQGRLEVVAVDSGSQDDTLKILESYGARIFRIKPEDFHHSKTRNFGASKSEGKVLVYLTQDALPINNDLLNNLLDPLNNEDFAVVYGRQIANLHAKKIDSFFYSYFYPDEKKVLKKKHTLDTRKFYMENIFVSDVCSAIKKDVWKQLKFSDDVSMSEDKDFALKALKAGYKIVYEPEAAVYHSHDYSLGGLFKRRFKDGAAFSSIALQGEGNFLMRGLKYFTQQMKFLIKNNLSGVPYALAYNFIYFLGFFLGNKEKYLPNFVKNPILTKN
jgi:rhamnosyltransferase